MSGLSKALFSLPCLVESEFLGRVQIKTLPNSSQEEEDGNGGKIGKKGGRKKRDKRKKEREA